MAVAVQGGMPGHPVPPGCPTSMRLPRSGGSGGEDQGRGVGARSCVLRALGSWSEGEHGSQAAAVGTRRAREAGQRPLRGGSRWPAISAGAAGEARHGGGCAARRVGVARDVAPLTLPSRPTCRQLAWSVGCGARRCWADARAAHAQAALRLRPPLAPAAACGSAKPVAGSVLSHVLGLQGRPHRGGAVRLCGHGDLAATRKLPAAAAGWRAVAQHLPAGAVLAFLVR